jgi:hypothetical protein
MMLGKLKSLPARNVNYARIYLYTVIKLPIYYYLSSPLPHIYKPSLLLTLVYIPMEVYTAIPV